MISVLIGLSGLIIFTDIIISIGWLGNRTKFPTDIKVFPSVSILVAARNEEEHILKCLEGLNRLEYPISQLDIWIGNDASTDQTYDILKKWSDNRSHVNIINISENLGDLKGKSNVLAQLAKKARGEFLLVTDADTVVPKLWVKQLINQIHTDKKVAMVSGYTVIRSTSIFSKLQNLEWINAFAMLNVVGKIGIPVTAIGNNMIIEKKIYDGIGGYEKLGFSLVEDFQLTRAIINKGYGLVNSFDNELKAVTEPETSFSAILKQRKRWMQGALKIPIIPLLILWIKALFIPVLIVLIGVDFSFAIIFFVTKLATGYLLNCIVYIKMREKLPWLLALLYDIYAGLMVISTLLFFIIPVKVDWKGRKY
jgi:cellulose synthase/poly-beta-1,6-N-acetylglucosamine synthase-like glycosyltransferase